MMINYTALEKEIEYKGKESKENIWYNHDASIGVSAAPILRH